MRNKENLDKAISFDQKGESMYSLQLSGQVSTQWLTVASPYIPDTVVPALTWDLSRSKVHNLPQLAKRLGGWIRAYSLASNGAIQESRRRNRNPLNMQVI
jgi:hypothetical protein